MLKVTEYNVKYNNQTKKFVIMFPVHEADVVHLSLCKDELLGFIELIDQVEGNERSHQQSPTKTL